MRILIALLLVALTACNNAGKSDDKTVSTTKSDKSEKASENFRNDISFKESGLKVQQAFLLFEDGRLVPTDNKVEVGQQVNLRLIIEGWEPVNGKVFLGASEKISTDEGTVILDETDLFASYADGIDATAAGLITLSAVITRVDKLFKYFEVAFKVWDKKSNDNVTGSYRLYLK
ncbi:MAG TPA: hypothetical protein VGD17_01675 [Chitinophagaceae bacterium]